MKFLWVVTIFAHLIAATDITGDNVDDDGMYNQCMTACRRCKDECSGYECPDTNTNHTLWVIGL